MEPAPFATPVVGDGSDGWGPSGHPGVFEGIPYQPFSRHDRIGRAADFLAPEHVKRYPGRFGNSFGGGDAFAYTHEDESNFKVVDNTKMQKSRMQDLRKWQTRNRRPPRVTATRGVPELRKDKARDRDRMKLERKLQKKWANTAARRGARQQKLHLDPSIEIKGSWTNLVNIEFDKLGTVTMEPTSVKDLASCGELMLYNRSLDNVEPRNEIPLNLNLSQRTFVEASTKDDPILQEMASQGTANIFATDAILATLMASTKSVYSWDIIMRKHGNNIFFEKRDLDTFDLLNVDENALQPPTADEPDIDSPHVLSVEATKINQAFSQQALNPSRKFKFKRDNPFADEEEEEMASVAYRYRMWEFDGGYKLVARCEHSALQETKAGKKVTKEYVMVRAFNEWNDQIDWRHSLATQRLSIISAYLKNNANVVSRWTFASMLAGNTTMKFGFVSRATPEENERHTILGVHSVKTKRMAEELKLDLHNGFGIVMSLVKLVEQQGDGEYVVLKDPSNATLRVYKTPESVLVAASSGNPAGDEIQMKSSAGWA